MEAGPSKLKEAIDLAKTDPKAYETALKSILSTPSGKFNISIITRK